MEVKLGGWGYRPMPKMLGGQFKVIRGHPMSNGLPMLYGLETCMVGGVISLETWWVESSPGDKNIEDQFKVTRGHPRSNG